jgi:uncharacterized protein (TIGR04255 family)
MAAEPRSYLRAPITEAIIDFQISPAAGCGQDGLATIVKSFLTDYPEVNERFRGSLTVELPVGEGGGTSVEASSRSTVQGFVAFSIGRERAFQARLDGFSASKLAPYKTWEDFREEARRLWLGYKEVTKPGFIRRIGLRYINRIDIPLPCTDIKDFIRTTVEISPELPQAVTHFYMQLHLPEPDLNVNCVINSALLPRLALNFLPVLFDIDLFRETNVPQDEIDIWGLLDEMRTRKNEIFEGSITDRARELFR